MATTPAPQIDPQLLDILRCPIAVHYKDKGDDPGRLELVGDGYWLHCADSGYNYPIIDGIPKMLVEEGAKWRHTEIDALPVPPPNEPVYAVAEDALPPEMRQLVETLNVRSQDARLEAVKQLQMAAQEIRREAEQSGSGTASVRASEMATELENAAEYVENGKRLIERQAQGAGVPWLLVAFGFAVGLLAGMVGRRNNG